MTNLRGQVAMVTGASSGIGRATAIELARQGVDVVLAARRQAELETAAGECRRHGVRALAISADVTSRDSVRRLVTRATEGLGAIDLLVNNAGFALYDPVESAKAEEIESMIRTNYLGAVHCTQAVLPAMLARGRGTIVNLASIVGLMGFARMSGYCASKYAMVGFTEALRDEVMNRGVRVSMVCPGTVETEFFRSAERGKMPAASRLILAIPPERVARAVRKAAQRGSYRVILPWTAAAFMRFKECFPRSAHFLMRNVSRAMDRGPV